MKAKDIIEKVKVFVLDLDGTVYLGDKVIPGAPEFIDRAKKTGKRIVFFTNNASRSKEIYFNKLKTLNFKVNRDEIVTSGDVTIDFLKKNFPQGRIFLNGTPVLEESFKKEGINLVENNPDLCIQSFDTTLTYEKLVKITDFIRDGIPFIATHCDINCPTETGFIPDCGAMCALITASTGVFPKYLGKPEKETAAYIADKFNIKLNEAAFVGDRIYTDVATGVNNGAMGILVLSGESDMNTVAESEIDPTLIFDSVADIIPFLRG